MALGLLAGSTGCELIASVDRSKIPDTDGTGGAGGHGGAGSTSSASSTSSAGGGGAGGGQCVPQDDNNECTDDKCKPDNTTDHTPKAAGSACMNGGSMCDGNGHCVQCLAPSDCPGMDDACQTRTCGADGKCGFDYAAAGTAIPMQTAGDCKETQCDGKGGTTDANKDTDLPDDKNACTDDICTAGVPSNPQKMQGASCGVTGMGDPLVCDDMGQCVGCNAPTDCPGSDDECKARTCVNHACGVSFTPVDTPVAAQTANDCLVQVCDGNGNIKAKADDNDPPKDDGNACTDEACAGGVPQHPQKPNGTGCSDGDACTQLDTCQTGTCVGGSPMTCNAADQCHTAGTCDPATGMCSNPAKMDGSACDDNNPCTQTDTCQAGACAGSNQITCNAVDQCHTAGTCDPATGMCSNPAKMDGSACDDNNPCTLTDACQAGACTGSNQITCIALDQCHAAGTCDPATGMCSNPAMMDGSACNDGDACTQTDTCQAGACTGSNQVACNSPGPCEASVGSCNPMNGMCSYTQQPDGAACVSGGSSGTCQSGVCNLCGNGVMDPGEVCDDNNTVDGDGCDSNCTITGCGNGVVTAGEACDDGNKLDNDGCSAKCAVEVPYACAGNKPSVCTSPKEINCNDGKDNDGDGLADCADADCALACDVNVGACGAGETALVYTATDVPIPIPDNSLVGATSTVTVGGVGAVKRVVVQTTIAHTYDADIDLTLMSPGGLVTDVSSDNGSSGDNYTKTIFNSACATSILAGSPPYTGCFRPEADFTSYVGAQAKGAWKLKAADDEALISGTLQAYSLALCVAPTTCGDGVVDAGEACDDGNNAIGDGCTPACTLEAGFNCAGSPSVCSVICGDGVVVGTEQCDDGNATGGDGCTACAIDPGAQCKPGNPSVCYPKEANCNNGLDDDGDGMADAADPDCAIPAYFPACAAGQTLLVYNSIFVPQSIPDNNTTGITSAIFANAGGTIARAAVLFNITHTYDADVDLSLITPANATLDISSDNGSSGANYTSTVLDSTCATSVTSGTAPFSGCYKPETAFTSLVGTQANGTWTLKAADDASSDTGTLNSWKMIFCTTP